MDMSELDKFEQKVGVLKLSEAIRIGAKLRLKAMRMYCDYMGATCALGAAAHARGWEPRPDTHSYQLYHYLPEFKSDWKLCESIMDSNDAGWSREEIADEVEAKGY